MTDLSTQEIKETGSHYTPKDLAQFVTERMLQQKLKSNINESIKLLDPAVGDGQLLESFIKSFDGDRELLVHGFDTNEDAVSISRQRLEFLNRADIKTEKKDFLSLIIKEARNDLFSSNDDHKFYDYIIANPPYIRTQVLGSQKAQRIAKNFNLSGRVDIYHAFIEGIGEVLKEGGVTGIIVSNRFMSTKGGRTIRERIRERFEILEVWDFGDTKIFDAAVLPVVLILRKNQNLQGGSVNPKMTKIYSTDQEAGQEKDLFTAIRSEGVYDIGLADNYEVEKGRLHLDEEKRSVWRLVNDDIYEWLKTVEENTFKTFSDLGKIKVGVKTTADKVFIRDDWEGLENKPEVLKPVTTHKVARRFKPRENDDTKILYTHEVENGKRKVINLEEFPNTEKYLKDHYERLSSRNYVIEAGREWFEIWVPHDPKKWNQTKVVFRDISEKPTFWIDRQGKVVNGDCYWFTSEKEDDLWLALAIANSEFIEKFYDYKFNNKLYSGRRRYITQYVKDFPLPDPDRKDAIELISLAKKIYNLMPAQETSHLEDQLNKLVWEVFDVD